MMNFKLTCPDDGFTKVVSAASKEEAVQMLMADPEMAEHGKTHPDMAGKTPEEMTAMFMSMVTEETAAPTGGAM